MRILITGGKGMLGMALNQRLREHELSIADLPETDICDAKAVNARISAERPDAVIHCAAATNVDACQTEVDAAWRVNAIGTANVASASHRHGARLFALSTDYVFSGDLDRPYHEWDIPAPKTVYGQTKLAAERAVRDLCPDHVILRTAWLYGCGGRNFVDTMLELCAGAGDLVRVVDDQHGNPTSTAAVADRIAELLELPMAGTFHVSCEGEASWYEFAREIFESRRARRKLDPCKTHEFPRRAPRPANSRLDKMALRLHGLRPMPHWRQTLEAYLQERSDG